MTSSNRVIVKVGGTDLDITDMPPVTLGDKRQLKRDGVKWESFRDNDPDSEAHFILLALRKMRPITTIEEVDALPARVAQDVVKHVIDCSARIDSPLSPSSTPLPGTTGGATQS